MSDNIFLLQDQYLEYLKQRKASPLTIRNYRHYLVRFSEFLKQNFPTIITPKDINQKIIQEYILYLSKFIDIKGNNLDSATQAYHLIALRSFFKYILSIGVFTISAEIITIPRLRAKEIKFLDNNQVEKLVRLAENARDRSILELILSTGLRVSDVIGLDKNNIDFHRKEIRVLKSSSQVRKIFLSESTSYWLRKYFEQREDNSDALFVRTAGKKGGTLRLTVRSIQRIIEKYVKKADFSIKATPHSLRHTFAINLLSAGTPLSAIKNILDHKNISTTQIYTHVTNPQLRQVHQKFHRR